MPLVWVAFSLEGIVAVWLVVYALLYAQQNWGMTWKPLPTIGAIALALFYSPLYSLLKESPPEPRPLSDRIYWEDRDTIVLMSPDTDNSRVEIETRIFLLRDPNTRVIKDVLMVSPDEKVTIQQNLESIRNIFVGSSEEADSFGPGKSV